MNDDPTSGIFWDRCILCQQEDDENLKQPAKNTKKEDIIRTYCNTVVLLKEFDYNLPGKFFHGHRGLSTLTIFPIYSTKKKQNGIRRARH